MVSSLSRVKYKPSKIPARADQSNCLLDDCLLDIFVNKRSTRLNKLLNAGFRSSSFQSQIGINF